MKIGIDCRMYGSRFTGIGIYTQKLVEYLAKRDAENEYVLFLSKEGMSACEVANPNFRKVLADVRHYSIAEQAVLPFIIAREKVDLMHFTHFNAPLAYRGPTVVTIHDLTLSFYPGRKMTSSLHRMAYHATIHSVAKRAKAIFAVSAYTKKDLIEILDVPEEKVTVIHNGIDRARFETEVSEEAIAKTCEKLKLKRPYLLYTGVFREHKNLVRLVEAFAMVAKQLSEVDLVLAGKEDPGYRDVRDAVVRLGLSGRVRLPGFVDDADIVALYRWASAYVFPSLYEGFGLPVLEAMAAGLPVLCSKGSSLTEIAGEGNAAFFDPLDVGSIAFAIREFFEHEGRRSDYVAAGKKRVLDFSWEKMGENVLLEYRKFAPKA